MTAPRASADHLASLPPSVRATVLVGVDSFSGACRTAPAYGLAAHEDVTVVSIEEFDLGGRAGRGGAERRLRAREDWPLYTAHRDVWRRTELALAAREWLPGAADVVARRHPDGSLDTEPSSHR